MTKNIRIENADTSDHIVVVETYDIDPTGSNYDMLVSTRELKYPTEMVTEAVWDTRIIIIREKNKPAVKKETE